MYTIRYTPLGAVILANSRTMPNIVSNVMFVQMPNAAEKFAHIGEEGLFEHLLPLKQDEIYLDAYGVKWAADISEIRVIDKNSVKVFFTTPWDGPSTFYAKFIDAHIDDEDFDFSAFGYDPTSFVYEYSVCNGLNVEEIGVESLEIIKREFEYTDEEFGDLYYFLVDKDDKDDGNDEDEE